MTKIKYTMPDSSWIAGKYVVDNEKVEINNQIPYVAVDGYRHSFYVQGDDAEKIIAEIHKLWLGAPGQEYYLTTQEAVQKWINQNL